MAQNIALNVRTPQPDLAAITRAAQDANAMDYKLQNAPARSELEALQLQDEMGERTALGGYREAAGKGDPKALDKLSGYPELQKKMYETFDGMSPQEFMEAKKRSTAFVNAAKFVGTIDGTPEQEQRWLSSAKVLKDAGYINDQQFNMMVEAGPSDLMMQQAMTADQWLKAYGGKPDKDDKSPEMKQYEIEKIQAEIRKLDRTGADDETAKLKLQVLEAQIAKLNAQTEGEKAGGSFSQSDKLREKQFEIEMKALVDTRDKALEMAADPEEISKSQAEFTAALQALMKRYGLSDADVAAKMGAAPAGSVDADAAEPSAESNALQQAQEAIAAGADPAAVKKRLEENGIDASGL